MGYEENRRQWDRDVAALANHHPLEAHFPSADLQESEKDGSMSKPIVKFNWGLPTDSAARKRHPIVTGFLDYFPAAAAGVAFISWAGNEKHNPGQELHWARGKSTDQEDCIGRHTLERGEYEYIETPTAIYAVPHSMCRAWRAMAAAQLDAEAHGAPVARGAK